MLGAVRLSTTEIKLNGVVRKMASEINVVNKETNNIQAAMGQVPSGAEIGPSSLVIVIDTDQRIGPSKSKKTMLVASSLGNKTFAANMCGGLNFYVPK